MRVFVHNFAHIEKGVKYRGKTFTYPKCLKVQFPNLDSSLTISALARTLLKNISMNLGLENSTFQHLGKQLYFLTVLLAVLLHINMWHTTARGTQDGGGDVGRKSAL